MVPTSSDACPSAYGWNGRDYPLNCPRQSGYESAETDARAETIYIIDRPRVDSRVSLIKPLVGEWPVSRIYYTANLDEGKSTFLDNI